MSVLTHPRCLMGVGLLGAMAVTAMLVSGPMAPFLVNESRSLPRGLYLRAFKAPALGAVVAVEPPPIAQAYLAGLGAPPDARLLKRIAAGPGETVCRWGARVSWPQGAAVALQHDRRGRRLPAWQGCHQLAADEVLVLGDTALSFDGRYFGPIHRSALHGVYRELMRW